MARETQPVQFRPTVKHGNNTIVVNSRDAKSVEEAVAYGKQVCSGLPGAQVVSVARWEMDPVTKKWKSTTVRLDMADALAEKEAEIAALREQLAEQMR